MKGRIVEDKQVVTLMRYYQLVKELENVKMDKLKEIIRELIKKELEGFYFATICYQTLRLVVVERK